MDDDFNRRMQQAHDEQRARDAQRQREDQERHERLMREAAATQQREQAAFDAANRARNAAPPGWM